MFTRAIVRPPGENFAGGLTTTPDLGAPELARALEQHEHYCAALARCGLELTRLPVDEAHPDSTFVEDTAVLAARCAVLTRPGAASRAGETTAMRPELQRRFPTLKEIVAPGTVDGGDICEAGEHFFIGISHRTNIEGAAQLVAFLLAAGYTASTVDIRDVPGILHLKSGLVAIDDRQLVAIRALADRPELRDYQVLRVADGEEYAANCVRVNQAVLVAAGFPSICEQLDALGYPLIELEMSEFQKMDGGLSCLSLRF